MPIIDVLPWYPKVKQFYNKTGAPENRDLNSWCQGNITPALETLKNQNLDRGFPGHRFGLVTTKLRLKIIVCIVYNIIIHFKSFK